MMTKITQEFRTPGASGHSILRTFFVCPVIRYRRFIVCFLLTILAIHVNAVRLEAQQAEAAMINREYKIKAAYLYNFARYVEWPQSSFKDSKEPFIIGIVGSDPIRKDLEQLAKSRKIENRPIQIKVFEKPNQVTPCHILFLAPSLQPKTQEQILKSLAGKNVLFVGETSNFLDMGGVIDFVVHQNRIRVAVALEAAQRENLKVSAKLLRVAQVVKR